MTTLKTLSRLLLTTCCVGVLAVTTLHGATASAQVVVEVVPPEFIATAEPVYYEGHSVYWYNGRWMYRDARGGWGWYHDEPGFLRDRRAAWGAGGGRRYYGGGGYRGAPAARGWGGGGGHRR